MPLNLWVGVCLIWLLCLSATNIYSNSRVIWHTMTHVGSLLYTEAMSLIKAVYNRARTFCSQCGLCFFCLLMFHYKCFRVHSLYSLLLEKSYCNHPIVPVLVKLRWGSITITGVHEKMPVYNKTNHSQTLYMYRKLCPLNPAHVVPFGIIAETHV